MPEYHFKIQFDRFSAELAVASDCSLYDLAKLIIKAVDFDFDHAFEFCDNLRDPDSSKERYTLFADIGEGEPGDSSVKKTPVSAVFRPRRKMVFHFDYGDDWYFLITCTAVKESTGERRLRKVLSTRGTPPEQYPAVDE
jgi:hypothetical protein